MKWSIRERNILAKNAERKTEIMLGIIRDSLKITAILNCKKTETCSCISRPGSRREAEELLEAKQWKTLRQRDLMEEPLQKR